MIFNKNYTEMEYNQQFGIRLNKHLEKIARMEEMYRDVPQMPKEFWEILNSQKRELQELKLRTGRDTLPPIFFS